MSRITRKEFLGFGAALAGAVTSTSGAPGLAAQPAQQPSAARGEPDFIVVNAKVYTVNPAAPRAEAFAVKDGRFVAVGSTARTSATSPRRGRA